MRLLLLSSILVFISSCSSRLQREDTTPQQFGNILIQNYSKLERSGACGAGPVMRFIDFEYNYTDSLIIEVAITTSLAEEPINGKIDILTDEYTLAYQGKVESKQYHETVEVETNRRYPQRFRTNRNLINTIVQMSARKGTKRVSGDQNWNSLQTTIANEDVPLLLGSQELQFEIMTNVCTIQVWPSPGQVRELRNFLEVNQRRQINLR